MALLVRNWKDLDGLENESYRIEVDLDMGCGWIRAKNPDNVTCTLAHTLSMKVAI